MKILKKLLGVLFVVAILGLSIIKASPMLARADFSEGSLVILPEDQSIVVLIEYKNSRPEVYLVDPEGHQLGENEYADIYEEKGYIYIYLENAMAGEWLLRYDKLDNENLSVSVNPWYKEVQAEYIEIVDTGRDSMDVRFLASADRDVEYNYFIYIVPEKGNSISDRYILNQGQAGVNEEGYCTVDISRYPDGNYYLIFEATLSYDGAYTATEAKTGIFTLSGKVPVLDPSDIVFTIDKETNEIDINWSAVNPDRDEWIFALFVGDEKEPTFMEGMDADSHWNRVFIEKGVTEVHLELTPKKEGVIQGMYKKTISMNDGTSIVVPEEYATNAQTFLVDYDTNDKDMTVKVQVNEGISVAVLKGKGSFSAELEKMTTNEIVILTSTEKNVFYKYITRITVDTFPPELTLYAVTQHFKTSLSELTIKGKTEAGCVVTLNDKPVAIDEKGNFTATVKLSVGDNTLTFSAVDVVGNKAVNAILVTRDNGLGGVNGANSDFAVKDGVKGVMEAYGITKISNVVLGAIVGVLAVIVVLIAGLVFGKKDKLPGKLNKMLIGLLAYIAVLTGFVFVYSIVLKNGVVSRISGENLANAIDSMSIEKLANLIRLKNIYGAMAKKCGIVAGIAALVAVIDIIVTIVRKKVAKAKA